MQLFLEYGTEANSKYMRAEQIAGASSHVNLGVTFKKEIRNRLEMFGDRVICVCENYYSVGLQLRHMRLN